MVSEGRKKDRRGCSGGRGGTEVSGAAEASTSTIPHHQQGLAAVLIMHCCMGLFSSLLSSQTGHQNSVHG